MTLDDAAKKRTLRYMLFKLLYGFAQGLIIGLAFIGAIEVFSR